MNRKLFGVSAAISAAAFAAADGKVGDISCSKQGEGSEVFIQGATLAKPKAYRQAGSKVVILEFKENQGPKPGKLDVHGNGVEQVRWQKASGKFRVFVELEDLTSQFEVVQKDGGWALAVKSNKTAPAQTGAPTIRIHTVGDQEYDSNGKPLESSTNPDTVSVPSSKAVEQAPAPKQPGSEKAEKVDNFVALAADGGPAVLAAERSASTPKVTKTAPKATKTAVKAPAANKVYTSPTGPSTEGAVSLQFSNTDVTHVLKALSMQSGVNIVTSPDVKGSISIALERVSVTEALDYVTAMTGLRYGKVNNTYLVATALRFDDLMRQFSQGAVEAPSSRVVPIYSGKGNQIKATLFKSYPIDSPKGSYDILLPSEDTTIKRNQSLGDSDKLQAAAAAAAQQTGGAAPATEGASIESKVMNDKTAPSANDNYVVLIGTQSRLDEIEGEIRRVDKEICKAMLIPVPEERILTQEVYHCVSASGKSLLAAICEPDQTKALVAQPQRTKVGNVQLFANNAPSGSEQIILLNGPKHEVANLMAILSQLDSQMEVSGSVQVYEVLFRDPRALKDDLTVQVPGLRVTLAPTTAAAPQLYKEASQKSDASSQSLNNSQASQSSGGQSGQGGQGGGDASTQGGAAGGSSSAQGMVSGGKADVNGIELPFANLENAAVPMKLVLRGSKAQLAQALEYLRLVDTAPKMVALEVRVMELTKSDSLKAGLDWNLFTGGAVKFVRLNNSQTGLNNSAGVRVNSGGISGDVIGQLDQIATKSNLIARPNVLATDGRQTEIFVGDVVRYVESIISSQNGVTVTTGTVRVGVRISVMPRVGGGDSITMDLRPIVSFLRGFTTIAQIQGQLPQTSERMSQQTVTMQSGETIAIGGLIQDQDRTDVTGVPLLMNLPIVGNLFKKQSNVKDRTELVIFISAKAVEGPVGSKSTPIPMQQSKDQIQYSQGKGGK